MLRAGIVQEVPEEMPLVGVHDAFRDLREVKEEKVPGLAELAGVVQSLQKLPRMGRVEDGPSLDGEHLPPTSAISSANAVPSPRCWWVTTGAEPPPGPPR